MKQKEFTGTRKEWEAAVIAAHSTARINSVGGGRMFAVVGSRDVGMFSTIQGGGWIAA